MITNLIAYFLLLELSILLSSAFLFFIILQIGFLAFYRGLKTESCLVLVFNLFFLFLSTRLLGLNSIFTQFLIIVSLIIFALILVQEKVLPEKLKLKLKARNYGAGAVILTFWLLAFYFYLVFWSQINLLWLKLIFAYLFMYFLISIYFGFHEKLGYIFKLSGKQFFVFKSIIGFIALELFIALSFLPLTSVAGATIFVLFVWLINEIARIHLIGKLRTRFVWGLCLLIAVLFVLIFGLEIFRIWP